MVKLAEGRVSAGTAAEPEIKRSWSYHGNVVPRMLKPFVFIWPVDELDVTSPFGYRMHPVVKRVLFHKGIDLAAPKGTPVKSSGPGVVEFAGNLPLTGLTVIVAHSGSIQTLYAHLEEILVTEGTLVDQGACIGLVGSTGRSTGDHLHFQVNRNGHAIDPTEVLGRSLSELPSEEPRTKTRELP